MRIAFKTFGCKANSVDTDSLYLEAKTRGHQIVSEEDAADAYIINSCTVTGSADRDARVHALKFKRKNPESVIAVIGCYAQVGKDELLSYPEVDLVVGTANKIRVLDHIRELKQNPTYQRDQVEPAVGFLTDHFPGSRYARANIKIQDGCNFSCSFCIIPKARGRSRSLSEEIVLKQINEAHAAGFNEVILTGIHIAHYGWDRNSTLISLLKKILAQKTGPRIRVSTLDPFEIPDELIQMLNSEERLCPHFHIAIQSGSDSVLKNMRRIYRAEEFEVVTNKIRDARPETFIGVDVIVGFPGEGEVEFQETLGCLERSYWTKLHVFPFSRREGTKAADLTALVPHSTITARSKMLRLLSEAKAAAFSKTQIGMIRQVLLERPSEKHPGLWIGHTENYLPTLSRVSNPEERKIVSALVTATEGERLHTVTQ